MKKIWFLIVLFIIISCANNTNSENNNKKPINLSISDSTIEILTWNLNFFYEKNNSDEENKYQNILEILKLIRADLISVQEISNHQKFKDLAEDLGNFSTKISESAYNNPSQSIGIIYNNSELELISSSKLTTINSNASRPPLLCEFKSKWNNSTFYAVAIHAKAFSDAESYNKRKNFSLSLKNYIDANLKDDRVIILGDFNDKLQMSITNDKDSPYKNFIDDLTEYFPVSLEKSIEASHRLGSIIDNILITNELEQLYLKNSFNVLQTEMLDLYPNFVNSISDHFPVFAVIHY